MKTGLEKSRGFTPSTTFSSLFRTAYRRIWASRALRTWEAIFWSVIPIYIAALLYGYNYSSVDYYLAHASWLIIIILPPLLTAVWVYIAHVEQGHADETLRTIPQVTSLIMTPRIAAVALSILHLLAPVLIVFIFMLEPVLLPIVHHGWHGPNYILSVLQLIGWMAMPIMWAMLVGSRRFNRGSSYMLAYFVPVFIYIPSAFILGDWSHRSYHGWYENLMHVGEGIWPQWMQNGGIFGLFIFPFIYIAACREWERPE